MANTDKEGNKLPQPRMKKREKSIRERQIIIAEMGNPSAPEHPRHCSVCGFRDRSPGHKTGNQHISVGS